MNFKNQRVIVTGGRGFIGTNLVNDLKLRGANVCIYDLKPGIRKPSCDLRDKHLIENFDPHYIFHMAADVGGIQYLLNNPHQVFYNNAKIILNVLDAAKHCKNLKGFLFPSSACVYSRDGGRGLKESDAIPADPHSSYGWSKLYGEMLVQSANIPTSVIVRMFNVYGPHDFTHEDSHVIPSLIMKVIRAHDGDAITVYGSGKQCRAFVYIDDIIDGLERAITYRTSGIGFTPILNLGTPVEISMKELVKKIIQISGKDLKIRYDKSKPEGEKHRSANIDLARACLGWEPKILLNDGLARTYKWAIENVKDK